MSSNIKIEKTCELCGRQFVAKTTVTRFCSHDCNRKAYKKQKRIEKIGNAIIKDSERKAEKLTELKSKEYLSIQQTCELIGASRWTIYRLIQRGELPAKKLGRRTIISRNNIDKLMSAL